MKDYQEYGVKLTAAQAKKLMIAYKNKTVCILRISKPNLHGSYKLPLTQTQINKIINARKGIDLRLSVAQMKHMKKTGGFLPLLALIPLIAGAVGAAGGLTGGIASAVASARGVAEQAKHNKIIEEQNKTIIEQSKSGTGVVSDFVGKIPLVGNYLKPLLEKIGLGMDDIKKIVKGDCVCHNGYKINRHGSGLYLEPAGEGLFLEPRR